MQKSEENALAALALRFASTNGGNVLALPPEMKAILVGRGLAETYPYRDSFAMQPRDIGHNRLHTMHRLTAAGFAEAGLPHRQGRVRVVFMGGEFQRNWAAQLIAREDCLRVAFVELPSPVPQKFVRILPPRHAEFSDHAGMDEALEAFGKACSYARGAAGVDGAMRDPAHIAWDGAVYAMEDVARLDAGGHIPADEVLQALRDAFAAAPAPAL